MTKSIKSRLVSLVGCVLQKSVFVRKFSAQPSVLPLLINHQPLSDAELAQCRDALYPLGYTAIRNTANHEIQIYRLQDVEEQMKAMEFFLDR